MKYFVCLFAVLIFKFRALGQVDYTVFYYPFINRAELSIIDGNYQKALLSYDTAFVNVSKPFARDYVNALVCAIKTGDKKKGFRFCDSLIAKGVSEKFFLEYGSLRPLWESPEWENFIKEYQSKSKKFSINKDTVLKNIILKLNERDQEFRSKPGSYRAYRDTINKIDSENVAIIRNIIRLKGFPNENMVGIVDPTTIFVPGYIVFHHYCQSLSIKKEGKYNFKDDFIKAVKEGKLDPHRFAFFLSLQNERSLLLGGWGVSKCKVGTRESKLLGDKYSPEKKKLINETRPLYGLESLEDYYKKVVFTLKNDIAQEFAFRVYEHINTFELEDDEQFEKFVLASEEIE